MRKIASPDELQSEIRQILVACQGPDHPSRHLIAQDLRTLAHRLVAIEHSAEEIDNRIASITLMTTNLQLDVRLVVSKLEPQDSGVTKVRLVGKLLVNPLLDRSIPVDIILKASGLGTLELKKGQVKDPILERLLTQVVSDNSKDLETIRGYL